MELVRGIYLPPLCRHLASYRSIITSIYHSIYLFGQGHINVLKYCTLLPYPPLPLQTLIYVFLFIFRLNKGGGFDVPPPRARYTDSFDVE